MSDLTPEQTKAGNSAWRDYEAAMVYVVFEKFYIAQQQNGLTTAEMCQAVERYIGPDAADYYLEWVQEGE